MTQPQQPPSTNRRTSWLIAAGLLFVVALLVVAFLRPGASTEQAEPAPEPEPTTVEPAAPETPTTETPPAEQQGEFVLSDLARRIDGDPLALGDVDAPIVMIEFADYRCPYCGVFTRETLPTLIEDYVEPGLLRFEWWDDPIFGDESVDAAVAARAAGEQGMFWDYYNAVFAYEGGGHQELGRDRLLEIANEIGVPDLAQFEADLENPEIISAVNADFTAAQALQVFSTPAFVVGNTPVMGAQPLEIFREVIDAELASLGL